MLCPSCGFEVDDTLLSCPYCDADLTQTSPLRAAEASWCASCGSILGPEDETCPHCGAERQGFSGRKPATRDIDSTSDTRLVSALPAEEDTSGVKEPKSVPIRRYVVALVAGCFVLAALVLVILQPWRQDAVSVERSAPNTSGESVRVINELSGQDFRESTSTRLGNKGTRDSYEWLYEGYEIMIGLAARLKDNWAQLVSVADGTYAQGLDAGRDEASAIVLELDALYGDIASSADVDDYLNRVGDLLELIDSLDCGAQGVLDAWNAAMGAEEADRPQAILQALDASGANDAAAQFVSNYQDWHITR